MKNLILTSIFTAFIAVFAFAQAPQPVIWEFTSNKVDDNTYELIFTADVEEGWSIYSQYLESDEGPIATAFEYDTEGVELVGENVEEGKKTEKYDEIFGMNVIKLHNKVVFTQKIKVQDAGTPVEGYVTYMSCDKERCLPPEDIDFSFEF